MDGSRASCGAAMRVPISVAAERAGRDVRTVQRWVQQGRVTAYDNGRGREVDLRQVLAVEADLRMRHQNRQQQRLAELLTGGDFDSVSL